jgi:hypothetical protein
MEDAASIPSLPVSHILKGLLARQRKYSGRNYVRLQNKEQP